MMLGNVEWREVRSLHKSMNEAEWWKIKLEKYITKNKGLFMRVKLLEWRLIHRTMHICSFGFLLGQLKNEITVANNSGGR